MEIHIEDTLYGDSYRGYNVWRLIYRVEYMDTLMEVQCIETHIQCTMYGGSYRGYNLRGHRVYNVWRFIYRVQCLQTHIEDTFYGYT